MSKFINYTVNGGLSINTFSEPQAACTDIGDIAEALTQGRDENLVCPIKGGELEILEDSEYWMGSNVSTESLEKLHDLISHDD